VLGIDVLKDPVGVRKRVGIIPSRRPRRVPHRDRIPEIRCCGPEDPGHRKKADWWFDFLDFADKKDVLCKDLSRGTGRN